VRECEPKHQTSASLCSSMQIIAVKKTGCRGAGAARQRSLARRIPTLRVFGTRGDPTVSRKSRELFQSGLGHALRQLIRLGRSKRLSFSDCRSLRPSAIHSLLPETSGPRPTRCSSELER
jgi:hypothetical protein